MNNDTNTSNTNATSNDVATSNTPRAKRAAPAKRASRPSNNVTLASLLNELKLDAKRTRSFMRTDIARPPAERVVFKHTTHTKGSSWVIDARDVDRFRAHFTKRRA